MEASRLLLQYTGDKFSVPKDGLTTLHSAAYSSAEEFVELLIKNGADVNQEGGLYQMTSLHLACHRLNCGSTHAQESTIRFVLQNGAHVNASDVFGETPLHYVVINGRPRLAEILLKDGANVHATSKLGETPLHYVCETSCFQIARLLIEQGAEVDACDTWGQTALQYCALESVGDEGLAELLLSSGANVQHTALDGTTSLHYAAAGGHSTIVQLLLDHGARSSMAHRSLQIILVVLHCMMLFTMGASLL